MDTLRALGNTIHSCLTNGVLVLNGEAIFSCSLANAYEKYIASHCNAMLITKEGVRDSKFGGYRVCHHTGYLVSSNESKSPISLGALSTRKDK